MVSSLLVTGGCSVRTLPPSFFLFMQRRKELEKEAIRAKRGAYQAYDDEEFEGEIGPGAKRKVSARAQIEASKS